jgi:phosphoglycolate phosphatase-like HAD superfamily hydrolase
MTRSVECRCFENSCRAGEGLELLPGITALLRHLKGCDDVKVGLVTGNLESIAWYKMEALGLKDLFTEPCFGGFGSDFCSGDIIEMWRDRAEMILIANSRAGGALFF